MAGRRLILAVTSAAVVLAACAGDPPQGSEAADSHESRPTGGLTVENAFVLDPLGADRLAFYATVINGGEAADTLLAVDSPVAEAGSLHRMAMEGGMMSMERMDGVPLPPGETVHLAPGALHGMLEGVTRTFTVGDSLPFTVTFATAPTRTGWARVIRPGDVR